MEPKPQTSNAQKLDLAQKTQEPTKKPTKQDL